MFFSRFRNQARRIAASESHDFRLLIRHNATVLPTLIMASLLVHTTHVAAGPGIVESGMPNQAMEQNRDSVLRC